MGEVWRWLLSAVVAAIALWFTLTNVSEAYGSGPPYYSRTTNMDKWQSPIPAVAAVDVTALALAAALLVPALRRRRVKSKG